MGVARRPVSLLFLVRAKSQRSDIICLEFKKRGANRSDVQKIGIVPDGIAIERSDSEKNAFVKSQCTDFQGPTVPGN